jgi:hypothetical protein
MSTANSESPPAETAWLAARPATRLGFWSAILTAVLALGAFGIGIVTPPRSGPFCVSACITYPYTDAAAFVPGDFLWLYPALLVPLTLVVLLACVQRSVQVDQTLFSQLASFFALIVAATLTADYVIQLAVVQPSLLKGETEGLTLVAQYNPHGIFIALEDAGYALMSVALLFTGLALGGPRRLERAIRWLFITSSCASLGALIGLSLLYGQDLEYRYEVTALSINWLALIVGGVLLSLWFTRLGRGTEAPLHRHSALLAKG